jgi:hypothetical protein
MQMPGALASFRQKKSIKNIYPEINDLTLAMDGQFIQAYIVQGHWIFHQSLVATLAKNLFLQKKSCNPLPENFCTSHPMN